MNPTAHGEEEFANLLVAYDEALAAGTARDSLQQVPVSEPWQGRLRRAQGCLDLLAALWPEPAPRGPANELRESLPWTGTGRIGRFLIEREIGRGGFGIVYLAYDPSLKRPVALKIPRLEALWTAELRQRFLREAEITGGLEHPHIVPVYEAGEAGPVCYIASAYCPGVNLTQWLAGQPAGLSPRQAALLAATLADALAYCHARGILHRDLKPSNIMLVPVGDDPAPGRVEGLPFVPRLTDFGLAKLVEGSLAETRSSVILGTPLYMAPEQAKGRLREIGPATDIYSLGAILYETLAGAPPFPGATLVDVLDRVRSEEPLSPNRLRPGQPPGLETICLKCLRKEPRERYGLAQDLADDLRRFLRGEPVRARPASVWSRLRSWCRRPERIGEAANMAFASGLMGGITPIGVAFALLSGMIEVADRTEALASIAFSCWYPMIHLALAYFTLARRRWAVWAGAILNPLLLLWASAAVLGRVPMGGVFADRDPTAMLILELVTICAVGTEALLYLAAVQALVAQERDSRLPAK